MFVFVLIFVLVRMMIGIEDSVGDGSGLSPTKRMGAASGRSTEVFLLICSASNTASRLACIQSSFLPSVQC